MGQPSHVREPCCDLRYIGCDGTGIGVSIAQVQDVTPVWIPPAGTREPVLSWGRLRRCAVGDSVEGTAKDKMEARDFLKECTCAGACKDDIRSLRDKLDDHISSLPQDLSSLLEVWFTLDRSDDRWDPIRRIIRACSCQDSLLGIIPVSILPQVNEIVELMTVSEPFTTSDDLLSLGRALHSIQAAGMGPEIAMAVETCKTQYKNNQASGQVCVTALSALLKYIGVCTTHVSSSFL
jgi:hypothetical protein